MQTNLAVTYVKGNNCNFPTYSLVFCAQMVCKLIPTGQKALVEFFVKSGKIVVPSLTNK